MIRGSCWLSRTIEKQNRPKPSTSKNSTIMEHRILDNLYNFPKLSDILHNIPVSRGSSRDPEAALPDWCSAL